MGTAGFDWLTGLFTSIAAGIGATLSGLPLWVWLLGALLLGGGVTGAVALWGLRRVHRLAHDLRVALVLMGSRHGRQCLRMAREIRVRGRWLRHTIRHEVEDRGERQALIRRLDRFITTELPAVLETARVFISQANDREETMLRERLDRQTRQWAEHPDAPGRESQLEAIARTRQQLARAGQATRERERLLHGLTEAVSALRDLEAGFAGLRMAREQPLPQLREHLDDLSRQLTYLKEAHEELAPPRDGPGHGH